MCNRFRKLVGTHIALPPQDMDGLKICMIRDSSVQFFDEKIQILRQAIRLISSKMPNAFHNIPFITVYMGKNLDIDVDWNPFQSCSDPTLFLGDEIFELNHRIRRKHCIRSIDTHYGLFSVISDLFRGNLHYKSGSRKGICCIIHLLAHIVHTAKLFSSSSSIALQERLVMYMNIPRSITTQVNLSLNSDPFEFVAEVFTGLILGRTYTDIVLREYDVAHGPRVSGQIISHGPDVTHATSVALGASHLLPTPSKRSRFH